MTTPQKPPPKTIPGKSVLKKFKSPQLELEIYVEIAVDVVNHNIKGGVTKYYPIGAIPDGKGGTNLYMTPTYNWQQKGAQKIVSKIVSALEIKGTIKIQTEYGPKSKATDTSAYGRGTTPEDKIAGKTTLGFHEACHREDFLTFLRTKALPTFNGRVGMTVPQFQQAGQQFGQALNNYLKAMGKDSESRTDEVGLKKSSYKPN